MGLKIGIENLMKPRIQVVLLLGLNLKLLFKPYLVLLKVINIDLLRWNRRLLFAICCIIFILLPIIQPLPVKFNRLPSKFENIKVVYWTPLLFLKYIDKTKGILREFEPNHPFLHPLSHASSYSLINYFLNLKALGISECDQHLQDLRILVIQLSDRVALKTLVSFMAITKRSD